VGRVAELGSLCMNKARLFRITAVLAFAGLTVFFVGYVVGLNSYKQYFLRLDSRDRRNLNDGFSLAVQNTTGRVETLGSCWTEQSNGVIRIITPGKLGRTFVEISTDGKFVGGRTSEGP